MNKLYKLLIVSVLSISSLALPALTNQASAQEPAKIHNIAKPTNEIGMVDFHMLRNSNVGLLYGYTR